MHEYSLAYGLLEALLEHLGSHPVGAHVRAVHVRKGELVILSEEALKEAWRILSEGTLLAGSELELEPVSTRISCQSCGYVGPAENLDPGEGWHVQIPLLSCPRCGGRVDVLEGKELAAVSLSVDGPLEGGPSPPSAGEQKEVREREGDTPEGQCR